MATLSVGNLLLAIGVGFDSQLKAADNLFFSTAIDLDDPTRPMFGGAVGNTNGLARRITDADAEGYVSLNNGIDGDPVAVKQISTADGPRYVVTNGSGKEIMIEDPSAGGSAQLQSTPRFIVKSDGVVYDSLVHSQAGGTGQWRVADPAQPFGGTGLASVPSPIAITHYARPVGRITFKAKEGATLARAQDELSRIGSSVQLLTRLLESIQDESRSFTSIIR
ncbi:hypothetical protein COW36_13815 [bacterium (Candidatus Blackallbacteria) CG17_big_fil_post_rev_8_21_14_2_50_48_46]|uniref:Uncharacterized protein n=1 Tax=bacterium (Candidatus Blackallbacteria) CG17_big_fil_post_rev_8_21_14_2_50_48_46 TaxID=2014261 RepID=A0A2M7G2Z3_9BACT|nr:MAG: hypothetical protein COW64_23290 [bacterium (Candidatus Blackallbacteria) CG18_big_fil_WC_8_21_14_2_50_49_26]PIW16205.1 MAG: hypothetical protein COW36_13815 [bacterium (Candidatus Blackallbacteria) CG17_big_fil_post_rev_8_21_14_2_50_48_46]PIW49912.1 MAG: hypothetical protein COW20_04490 [bacterium (Candidatus Blackallbacteria) CG13_big_fil_rev_8_21_14_2_50_49_14]